MQSVSSRIWTRVAVSNSYDDIHYTTGTSPQTNELCEIELLEIELFHHLIVYKQMTDVYLNCLWYIAILGII